MCFVDGLGQTDSSPFVSSRVSYDVILLRFNLKFRQDFNQKIIDDIQQLF